MTDAASQTLAPDRALRGPALTFTGDPFECGLDATMRYEFDAIVAFGAGRITHFGPASVVGPQLPDGLRIEDCGPDALISAGFLDSHVHFPQTPIIGSHGTQLLDWLQTYTFPMERGFSDKAFASSVAKVFLQECLRNGITTSCVYATVFPQSVDALFEEAERLGLRLAAGKVLMDRNAPEYLRDTAQSAYDDSSALIAKWHGRGRLMYAITPRFAVTSTPAQLEAAGALCREHPRRLHADACGGEPRRDRARHETVSRARELSRRLRPLRPVPSARDLRARNSSRRGRVLLRASHRLGDLALPHFEFLSRQRLFRHRPRDAKGQAGARGARHRHRRRHVVLDHDDAERSLQGGADEPPYADAGHAFYLATRGTARAMYIEDKVGSLAPGMEADIVVLDMKSTPIIRYRMEFAKDILEALFVQMTLGDDRAVKATYVAGELRYERDRPGQFS